MLNLTTNASILEDIQILALGPTMIYKKYHGFNVNSFSFHTIAWDESR